MGNQIWSFKLDRVAVEGLTAPKNEPGCPIRFQDKEKVTCESHSQAQLLCDCLPKRLIGPKCTAAVSIEGSQCNSLLDSGSQVTTVSKSFYDRNLSSQKIFPIQDLLDIEGAGGQEVPYLGYISTTIHFPESVMGKSAEVDTLILVVPHHRTNMEVPLLIWTNTLDILYETVGLGKAQPNHVLQEKKNIPHSPLVKHLYHRFKTHQDNGRVGKVKLQSKKYITVPAGEKWP